MSKLRGLSFFAFFFSLALLHAESKHKTENVFLITLDGLRWQEVFGGAEAALMTKETGGVSDKAKLEAEFSGNTPEDRRRKLMPFFWNVIAEKGQLYGNQDKGSVSTVTNGKKFTYPGFNEIFTGFADDRIDKNEKRNNPNVTVFEWLHRQRAFTNRVVGFANWDVHPYILNSERSGIPVWTDANFPAAPGSRLELVQQVYRDTTQLWKDMHFDSFYLHAAQEYVKEKKPRLVWIALSEPDEWAHEGRYDLYLSAARGADRGLEMLWNTLQSLPAYRNKTTFIITCDHGRGNGAEWRNHGASVKGAENTWMAVIGPDTHSLGERTNVAPVNHTQIAATLAGFLGQNYQASVPKAGSAIEPLLKRPAK